jgi:nicotinamide-nucleotide amidase
MNGTAPDVSGFVSMLGSRTLACAESCTGGMLAQAFAATPGSMDWFTGGVVAYQRAAKERLFHIPPAPLVSREVAEAMAEGAAEILGADVAVSITCAAGPDPLEGVPVGTVVVGLWVENRASSELHLFQGAPDEICRQARDAALADLDRSLRTKTAV